VLDGGSGVDEDTGPASPHSPPCAANVAPAAVQLGAGWCHVDTRHDCSSIAQQHHHADMLLGVVQGLGCAGHRRWTGGEGLLMLHGFTIAQQHRYKQGVHIYLPIPTWYYADI
jgi:hypothetical protein